ncbi:ABC transporter permease [Lichenihabitans sp. Uapishka_5]|uniref:ABC transporter permease n=1 Tax=Lichenihabitans sp. Uapishka_5 TaxID=3037302 RepID=UPI0029E7ECBB|nr:ABC transporter permease [Lichenihabitans sp. Uapishka_5]MDX7951451.1 ABC transporter permease [Lichenihabitans sp. Uapishka_5]
MTDTTSGLPPAILSRSKRLRAATLEHGFVGVLVLIFLFFALSTNHFATIDNVIAMLHTMAPIMVIAAGMAVVVLSGKLDISVGSVALLSMAVGSFLMNALHVPAPLAFVAVLLCGALLGALNAIIVVGMGINSLIATLSTMIALRGLGFLVSGGNSVEFAPAVRALGNLTIGPVFVDILLAAAVVLLVHLVHVRTPYGRYLNAIGNGEEVATRIGLPVRLVSFLSFVISGTLASLGGLMTSLQVGGFTNFLGTGAEFTAVAIVVVGGISLFGGIGAIVPGVILGAFTFEVMENGLNQMSANPFAYRLVTGIIIFVAMYVDSLKSGRAEPDTA